MLYLQHHTPSWLSAEQPRSGILIRGTKEKMVSELEQVGEQDGERVSCSGGRSEPFFFPGMKILALFINHQNLFLSQLNHNDSCGPFNIFSYS